MPFRFYIAAPLPLLSRAREVARETRSLGHSVTSSWHEGNPTVAVDDALPDDVRQALGALCLAEIRSSSALILLYGASSTRHGSIAEAGYALGRGLPVFGLAAGSDAVFPTLVLQGIPRIEGSLASFLSRVDRRAATCAGNGRPAVSADALGCDHIFESL